MDFTLRLRQLPFETMPTQIIYVEGRYDEALNLFIRDNYKRIRTFSANLGCEFCYLPKLAEDVLTEEVVFYNMPYAEAKELPQTIGSGMVLDFMVHPEDRSSIPPSLICVRPSYYDDHDCSEEILYDGYSLWPWWPLESPQPAPRDWTSKFFLTLDRVIRDIRKDTDEDRVLFRLGDDRTKGHVMEPDAVYVDRRVLLPDDIRFSLGEGEGTTADALFDSEAMRIADEVIERIRLLEKKGISRYVLERYITGKEKLSRLHITGDYRIFLPDYGNVEIEMKPLPKAVFLLFLRHPEGIMFSYLPDYRDELMRIYKCLRPTAGAAATVQSIEKVTDPLDNSINEKCSRIREAFIGKFEERLAQNYFITGKKGEAKSIKLPRELVEWDDAASQRGETI